MSESSKQLLQILRSKPLSLEEIQQTMSGLSEGEIKLAIFQLEKEYLITKQPVMGSCRACGCNVQYKWRLTFKGREFANT